MYKRILVPLDGSGLAERALQHAVDIARAFDGHLDLVRVVPVATLQVARAGDISDLESEVAEALEYLTGLQGRLSEEGLDVSYRVRQGDVAEEILEEARDCHSDIVVMCSHGRSGIARWVYGSIADRVLRYGLSSVPAILVISSSANA
ncbi:MAG: universal stress protein [Armatimonadota bacterium]